ncbi:hypothetical protein DJ480_17180 [Pseudomonas sp. Leaf98]|nr:hypothetical protein DJ480_17180 [Pseudomonas sp. Leaf98]
MASGLAPRWSAQRSQQNTKSPRSWAIPDPIGTTPSRLSRTYQAIGALFNSPNTRARAGNRMRGVGRPAFRRALKTRYRL